MEFVWSLDWMANRLANTFDRLRPGFHPISIYTSPSHFSAHGSAWIRRASHLESEHWPFPDHSCECSAGLLTSQGGTQRAGGAVAMWHGLNQKTSLVVPKGFGCWVYQSAKLSVPLYPTVGFWCEFPCIDALISSNLTLAPTTWDMLLDF
jgi:hypothetical protein